MIRLKVLLICTTTLAKRTTCSFIWWIPKKELTETIFTVGITLMVTCSAIHQRPLTRVRVWTSMHSITNPSWDKINYKEELLLMLVFNTGLLISKLLNSIMLMKSLKMNATREALISCTAGKWRRLISMIMERRLLLCKMLIPVKPWRFPSTMPTSTQLHNLIKNLLMLESLMVLV